LWGAMNVRVLQCGVDYIPLAGAVWYAYERC